MPNYEIGALADELGVNPSALSNLIYRRSEFRKKCPLIGGRRQVPREIVPRIAEALKRRQSQK